MEFSKKYLKTTMEMDIVTKQNNIKISLLYLKNCIEDYMQSFEDDWHTADVYLAVDPAGDECVIFKQPNKSTNYYIRKHDSEVDKNVG